jgi:hypothetical protein
VATTTAADSADEISDSGSEVVVVVDPKAINAFHDFRKEVTKLTGVSFPTDDPPTDVDLKQATAKLEQCKQAHLAKVKKSGAGGGTKAGTWAASFAGTSSSKKRDSLESATSEEGEGKGRGAESWGATSVNPSRFKSSLSRFVKSTPRQLRFGSGDPHDGHLGLFFIENATDYGERSLDSWFEEVEEELKATNRNLLRSREMYELRSRVWETMRILHNATFVNAALSGSDDTLEIYGRRLFCLSEVLAGNMEWSVAELYLPVGSVKLQSYSIPASKLRALGRNLRHANRTREAFKGVFTAKDKGKKEGSE